MSEEDVGHTRCGLANLNHYVRCDWGNTFSKLFQCADFIHSNVNGKAIDFDISRITRYFTVLSEFSLVLVGKLWCQGKGEPYLSNTANRVLVFQEALEGAAGESSSSHWAVLPLPGASVWAPPCWVTCWGLLAGEGGSVGDPLLAGCPAPAGSHPLAPGPSHCPAWSEQLEQWKQHKFHSKISLSSCFSMNLS